MAEKWPRDLWLESIWEDVVLRPNERIVAFVYYRYAGKGWESWCSWAEVRRRTGIRSKDAVWRAIHGLIAAGWLKEVDRPRQHRSAVYRLTVPIAASGPVDGPLSGPGNGPVEAFGRSSGEPEVRENVARGPANGDQRSVKREPIDLIENSEERSDAREHARDPSGARAAERKPTYSRGHEYDPDPWTPGLCRCGLPKANSVAHRKGRP